VRRAQGFLPLLENLLFPHGVLNFELVDCEPGAAVTVTTEWPHLHHVTGYLKYDPTPASGGRSVWYAPQNLRMIGRTVSYTITDGGLGDDDLTANGTIRDPSGPVIQSTRAIPLGGPAWALALAACLGLLAVRHRPRSSRRQESSNT